MLDQISEAGLEMIAVGKIHDIFAGRGMTESIHTENNADGIEQTIRLAGRSFHGVCFTNLVDFDMLYGHRNDVDGYAKALTYFDQNLPRLLAKLDEEDLLMITADHGCDPATPSTDHSREYVPYLIAGRQVVPCNLGTRPTFADIGATVLDYFQIPAQIEGTSLLHKFIRERTGE